MVLWERDDGMVQLEVQQWRKESRASNDVLPSQELLKTIDGSQCSRIFALLIEYGYSMIQQKGKFLAL